MKTLSIQKNRLAALYSVLKTLPPKQFENVEVMKQLQEKIFPVIGKEMEDYITIQDKIKVIQREFTLDRIKEEDANESVNNLRKEINKIDARNEEVTVQVEFEDADFNVFFDLFAKHGKEIFNKVEDYLAVTKNMDAANSQPKEDKKENK